MRNFKEEHNTTCRNIVEEMQRYYNGVYIEFDGDIYNRNELETIIEDNEEFYLINDNKVLSDNYNGDFEELTLWDYFEDVLDIRYTFNSDKELLGVELLIAFGGPNIWINTLTKTVELSWWNEYGECEFDNYLSEGINSIFEELFHC